MSSFSIILLWKYLVLANLSIKMILLELTYVSLLFSLHFAYMWKC